MPPTGQPQPQNQPVPPPAQPASPQPVPPSPQANLSQPTPAPYSATYPALQVAYPQPGPTANYSSPPDSGLPSAFGLFLPSLRVIWLAIAPIITVLAIVFGVYLVKYFIAISIINSSANMYQPETLVVPKIIIEAVYVLILVVIAIIALPMFSFAILSSVRGVRKSLSETVAYAGLNIRRFLPISLLLSVGLAIINYVIINGIQSIISWINSTTTGSAQPFIGYFVSLIALIPALMLFVRLTMACLSLVDNPTATSSGALKQSWALSRGRTKQMFGIAGVNTLIYAIFSFLSLMIYTWFVNNYFVAQGSEITTMASILLILCSVMLVSFLVAYSASIPILYNILLSQNRPPDIPNQLPPNVMPPMPQSPASV